VDKGSISKEVPTMIKRKKSKPGEAFYFQNGAYVETKAQLLAQLKKLTPEEFATYVNDRKNDVYNWLNSCLDSDLARKIEKVRNQKRMIELLK
jgi:hypothetical protein